MEQETQIQHVFHEILNEYQQFLLHNNKLQHFNNTYEEITGDLFSDRSSDAIAHCVSKCLTMNHGIALQFRNKFNNIDNLILQKKRVTEIAVIKTEKQWLLLTICTVKTINIQLEQARDDTYAKIIEAIQNPELSNHIWIRKSKNYFINENQILMYKHLSKGQTMNLIALPNNRINEILNDFHDHPISGHLGIDKTYNKIIQRYFWPTIYKDIRKYVTSCLSCQKRKSDKKATYGQMLTSPKIIGTPFQRFTIDYIGSINPPSNGNSYILVGTCATTKYAIAKSYKNADAKSTVAYLIDIILQFGAIETSSEILLELEKLKNIRDELPKLLADRFIGPFKIIKQISDVTYVIEIIKNGQLVNEYKHVSQLKKFKER
ncbi:hypothetical protein AGLY_017069 [Aphis glycines]|uniref:Uncharacterized protein n=1 Tax=Aphis glycines TaxID=307491 RepID=A0A6G0SVZ1_APHGL|nr:hypothetical protein AGLY_017069 [Aphis glycines]